MSGGDRQREKGQTLILVAAAMVFLLAFAALAIDVGQMYGERRRMQNAADAGALAGAWEICFGDPGMAVTTAQEYAIVRNGADQADVTFPDAWTVEVVAQIEVDSFVAGIIGHPTADVAAEAAATCGQADEACGLWPVAFEEDVWESMPCDETFAVWAGNNPNHDPDCEVYDCDLDGDGDDDVLTLVSRGWLDFSDFEDPLLYPDPCVQNGCGANELTCLLTEGTNVQIAIGDCISGVPGLKASARDDVEEVAAREFPYVSLPIFDQLCGDHTACPGDGYRVSQFGCIEVVGWEQKQELPRLDGANPPWHGKIIEGIKPCGNECETLCGGTSGGPPLPYGVGAVNLIK